MCLSDRFRRHNSRSERFYHCRSHNYFVTCGHARRFCDCIQKSCSQSSRYGTCYCLRGVAGQWLFISAIWRWLVTAIRWPCKSAVRGPMRHSKVTRSRIVHLRRRLAAIESWAWPFWKNPSGVDSVTNVLDGILSKILLLIYPEGQEGHTWSTNDVWWEPPEMAAWASGIGYSRFNWLPGIRGQMPI